MPLVHLAEDTLIRVVAFLDVPGILALRLTCTHLAALTRLKSVWLHAYVSCVRDAGLPCDDDGGDEDYTALSAADLEHRVCRAMRLVRAWRSVSSTPLFSPSASSGPSSSTPRSRNISASPSLSRIMRLEVGGPIFGILATRFVLRERGEWLVTFVQDSPSWPTPEEKKVQPEVLCWDLGQEGGREPRVVCRWACKAGARMVEYGVVTNRSVRRAREREGTWVDIAVSVIASDDRIELVLLSIDEDGDDDVEDGGRLTLTEVQTLPTKFRPVYLKGDILVLTNNRGEKRVVDWRTGHYAVLRNAVRSEGEGDEGGEEEVPAWSSCRDVHFAHGSILIARSRSVDLYPAVELRSPDDEPVVVYPLRTCTFGPVPDIAIAPRTLASTTSDFVYPSLTILIHRATGDPRGSNIHYVQEYVLYPDPYATFFLSDLSSNNANTDANVSPSLYLSPPRPRTRIPWPSGRHQSSALALGRAGTALGFQFHRDEVRDALYATVFPGPLNSGVGDLGHNAGRSEYGYGGGGGVKTVRLYAAPWMRWMWLDYVESRGCIALGAFTGEVTVLYI